MNDISRKAIHILFTTAFVCLLAYLLWLARHVLIYLAISAVIAIIAKPVANVLSGEKRKKVKLNRSTAAAITLLLVMGITGGILSIFVPALVREISVLSKIDIEHIFAEAEKNIKDISYILQKKNTGDKVDGGIIKETLLNAVSLDTISNTFTSLINSLGNLVFATVSILFISFFFIREKHLFRNIVLAFLPDNYEKKVLNVTPRLKKNLSKYFSGLLLQISIITILVSAGLSIIGLNNTIVIGFFAGLINIIPYLGPIIGMIFGLILGLSQNFVNEIGADMLSQAILILMVFGSVQLIDNFILQPVIFSNSINAHPLEIFIVISFAASIAGITGMIIAVPTYSVIRLLATEFFPEVKFIQRLNLFKNKK